MRRLRKKRRQSRKWSAAFTDLYTFIFNQFTYSYIYFAYSLYIITINDVIYYQLNFLKEVSIISLM